MLEFDYETLPIRVMILDARKLVAGTILEADVCIVGSGAAGLTLAYDLGKAAARVLLLESGGLNRVRGMHPLNEGTTEGEDYSLQDTRERALGGTTNRWSGVLVPLDAVDFRARDWIPNSGWPLDESTLAPFYERAARFLDAPVSIASGLHSVQTTNPALPPLCNDLEYRPIQFAKRLRLGLELRKELAASTTVELLYHATVTRLRLDRIERRVAEAEVMTQPQDQVRSLRVVSKVFVLAAGGIENARLMLVSPGANGIALGNEHDLVGRYFMEHRYIGAGIAYAADGVDLRTFTKGINIGSGRVHPTIALNKKTRQQHRMMDLNIRLFTYSQEDQSASVQSFRRLLADAKVGSVPEQWRYLLLQIASQPIPLARYFASCLAHHFEWNASVDRVGYVFVGLEQEPEARNRVTLSKRFDNLGVPLPVLRFRLSNYHWRSAERGLEILGRGLVGSGFGSLRRNLGWLRKDELRDKFGAHHMGTTRMHQNPRQGVVDSNCRVHSIDNLFVAGSSVFTTGGSANPTLTIVALAFRLAEHLRQHIGEAPTDRKVAGA